jgi:hypothetical protein
MDSDYLWRLRPVLWIPTEAAGQTANTANRQQRGKPMNTPTTTKPATNGQWKEAQTYAKRKWRVVPCHNVLPNGSCSCGNPDCPPRSRGKHPRIKEWQHNATTDPAKIRQWGRKWPEGNIGVQLGTQSGIIDVEHDDEAGRETAERILGNMQTPTYRSGSRSIHRLFRWQKGLPKGAVTKVEGLEIRCGNDGKGAQSVFPPSIHPTGSRYEWIIPPDQAEPAAIPPALLQLIANAEGEEEIKEYRQDSPPVDDRELALQALGGLSKGRAADYESWLFIGMALHSVDSSESMLAEWDTWSQSCREKYQPSACADKWSSFSGGSGWKIGSLVYWAKQDGWTPPPRPKARRAKGRGTGADEKERLSNAIFQTETDEDGEEKTVAVPRPMSELVTLIHQHTAGELRRIERAIFAHAAGKPIDWLDSTSGLFGYIQTRAGIVEWKGGPGFATKEETYCELQRQTPSYAAVETLPHWPPIRGHYYTVPIPSPGDGRTLMALIDKHCPETDLDRELSFAIYATGAWGGPPGTRPAFLVTASTGRGKGKTRYCQNFARTFGGYLDISPQEDIGTIKQRLLSPEAAQKRVATLDNLKTARFSWAEFENLITADTINGKRLYIGDASRPNLITWTITLNGASLSTDMAQRVVEIRLREPTYSETWEEEVTAFIDAKREQIIADCIGFLQRPAKPMKRHSRWATWEAQVLSKVDHPDDCLSLILDRRGAVDVEQEESEILEDYFAYKLTWLGYDPERDDVFIPNDMAARWYNEATGEQRKVTGVTRALKQLRDEHRTHRIVYSRSGDRTARGFRWVGEHADAIDVTHYDIRARLAEKLQERQQTP